MTKTLKESSMEYEPKSAKNITELESVDVDVPIHVETGTDSEGKDFSYLYVEFNGERYRVPDSVRASLKGIIEKKPDLKRFCVSKTGEGRQTRYTVIPIVD